jgi:tripartite-type tricarboxylate transporter receptor subunit TctC
MIVESWNGLIAPAGVPQSIIERLNAEANKALDDPEVRRNFVSMGGEVVGGSVPAFKAYIDEESTRWGALIKAADVRLD